LQNSVSIKLNNAGKKFGKDWIFRNVTIDIEPREKIAILGLNGSGKSTLLQALTGYLGLNEGELAYFLNHQATKEEHTFNLISLASPYLELIEDFTLTEQIEHSLHYKPFINNLDTDKIIELSGLSAHKNKYIKLFSSGMKQRLKLTLAILSDAPVLFLDEPTTNLDATVIDWYKMLINNYALHKTIIVCSNSIKDEYAFCNRVLSMDTF
jgi:ABC-type multidrug transport system ATPase subunit